MCGQCRCSHVVRDNEDDVVVCLARHLGGDDGEGIESLHAGLGIDVGGGLHGRNDLGSRGRAGADGGRCLPWGELLDCLVDGVDRRLEVGGSGGGVGLVNAADGGDLGQALRRTGDGHHLDADRGCIMGV